MNTKQIVSALGVLIVVGAIAAGVSYFAKAPAQTPATIATESPVLQGTMNAAGEYEYKEDAQYYTVDLTYPATIPTLSVEASAKAELTMEQALATDIAQFKTDGGFATLTAEDIQIQGLGPNRKYAYSAEYKMYQSPNTVSYVFSIYQDTLGAHPNGFYRTFTFDTQGNEVTLADLFKPGAAYLPKLSAESYKQVTAELKTRTGADADEGTLETARLGTSPSPEALQFFYVDGNTLGLLFPPYQVAAYAAGSFEVRIPLSSLQDILK